MANILPVHVYAISCTNQPVKLKVSKVQTFRPIKLAQPKWPYVASLDVSIWQNRSEKRLSHDFASDNNTLAYARFKIKALYKYWLTNKW